MLLKDYYGILEIETSASLPEIKKAYRRLAQQYHPDKKPGDPYAASRFSEVKEAYEILTNPGKKELYLQRRWYEQSIGRKRKAVAVTPENLLKQVLELNRYVSRLDVFRMDTLGLCEYVLSLLENESIIQLNSFEEITTNDQIVLHLLDSIHVLPLQMIKEIHTQLKKIKMSGNVEGQLSHFMTKHQKAYNRDKYKIWIILLAVISLCLLIIFFS